MHDLKEKFRNKQLKFQSDLIFISVDIKYTFVELSNIKAVYSIDSLDETADVSQ